MKPLVRACGLAVIAAIVVLCFRAALITYAVGQAANRNGITNWQSYGTSDPLPELLAVAEALAVAAVIGGGIAGATAWYRWSPRGFKRSAGALVMGVAFATTIALLPRIVGVLYGPAKVKTDIFDQVAAQPPGR